MKKDLRPIVILGGLVGRSSNGEKKKQQPIHCSALGFSHMLSRSIGNISAKSLVDIETKFMHCHFHYHREAFKLELLEEAWKVSVSVAWVEALMIS